MIQESLQDGSSGGDGVVHYIFAHYAEQWWEDGCNEVPTSGAGEGEVRHSVRRQAVFAVCALESWFFEWVRDEILGSVVESARLFEGAPRPLPARIKHVMSELHARGELKAEPNFGQAQAWDDLHGLLGHRNGLVHGAASYPRGSLPPDAAEASPTPKEIRGLAPDRPLQIVRAVTEFLTSSANSKPPAWMAVPDNGT